MPSVSRGWVLAAVGLAFAAQPLLAGPVPLLGAVGLAAMVYALHRSGLRWPMASPVGWRALIGLGAVLFVLALVVRVWRLDSVPPVLMDEGVEAYDAQCLAAGLPLEPLTGIHYHRSPLWSRVLALTGRVSGFSFESLRIPSVLAGSLAVAVSAAVVARLAGPLAAVIAGLWLVAHPWELHLSRIMLGNITVPLAGAAIVLLAATGLPAMVRAGLAGLVAGAAVWGYAAALALPPLAVLSLWLLAPPRTPVRRRLRQVAVCAVVAGLVASPTLLLAPGMWEKTRQVGAVLSPPVLHRNLVATMRMFHIEGDTDLRHNHPGGAPVFHGWLAPLFSLGLGVALASPRSPAALLALGWLYLGLLPGLASVGGGANAFRMAGVPPVAAWLLGAGGALAASALGRRVGGAGVVLLVALGMGADLRQYLVRMPADPAVAVWFRSWTGEAARELARRAAAEPIVVTPPLSLVAHPVEKAVLFEALRTGRARFGPDAEISGTRMEYRDPYGEPQSVLIVSGARIRYFTVLDVSGSADALVHAGSPRAAIPVIQSALTVLPSSALLRERLGFVRLAAGDLAGAEREFRAAVRLRPRLAASWDGLGGALYRQGRFREAEAAVLEAIRQSPEVEEFRADLRRIRVARTARMNP